MRAGLKTTCRMGQLVPWKDADVGEGASLLSHCDNLFICGGGKYFYLLFQVLLAGLVIKLT